MLHPEEIIELSEYLKRQEFHSSPYQIFAAQQVLFSEAAQDIGAGSLVGLSTLLGPIFCRTPEEQHKFEEIYLQWLRQRSGRPNTIPSTPTGPGPGPEIATSHWRMKVLGVALLILPILTAWFLWQDLRLRQVIGHVMTEGNPVSQATVRLGEPTATTEPNGEFQFPFQAKDMPMELAVEIKGYLPSSTPIGQSIKTNRNWFYLHPLDWSDQLNIGEILLSKEEQLAVAPEPPIPGPDQLPPAKLSLEQIATLKSPISPWWARLDYYILGEVLVPVLLALGWLLYRRTRRGRLQRQSSRIPPKLKHVQVQAGTQPIFPSLSLRHITQRLRQTRFVESTELDLHRTIQCTLEQGGLFTPVYGSKHEPGYVALIDRATMADHQAHLAAQLVKDLARGYVLVRQYEFDEQPIMLRSVDPLRPSSKYGAGGIAVMTVVEVVALEEVQAKFPARRLLCFADPITCFDPLTGKLHPWVETLEAWEERFLLTTTPDGHWGQAERILSRRGFQVIPLTLLGLRLFSTLLEQGSVSGVQQKSPIPGTTNFHDRMPERWLERYPPSHEIIQWLLSDLEQAFSQEKEGVNAERGKQGMLWLAACAAYPEIHWALTLEWGVRLFGHTSTAEILLPKLTRLVWFRHAFMPDWFRKALYDRLAGPEADRISQELSEILSAVNPENREGLQLHIATQPGKKAEPSSPVGPVRAWFRRLARKLKLQAMGQAAEPGSPMGDYVMLQYLSGKQGKALTPYVPKALLRFLFPKGQPWLGFRPVFLMVAAVLASGGLWWSWDPIPVPLPSPIQAVALSQDGRRLAVGREDGRLQVWDWKKKQMVVDLPGEHAPITSVALSADGKVGATGFQDGRIRLWDGTTGEEWISIRESSTPVVSLAFSKNGGRLATVSEEGDILQILTKTGKSEFVSFPKDAKSGKTLAFSPDGNWLALGGSRGMIWLKSGTNSILESNSVSRPIFKAMVIEEQTAEVKSLDWHSDGKFLTSFDDKGKIRIWNTEILEEVLETQVPEARVVSLVWPNPQEALMAISGLDGPEVFRLRIPAELFKAGTNQEGNGREQRTEQTGTEPRWDLETLKKGVVKVTAKFANRQKVGTGFIVGQDQAYLFIVTASHVVEGATEIPTSITVTFFTQQKNPLGAQVVVKEGGDPRGLALLKVGGNLPDDVQILEWDTQSQLQGGEGVLLIGFPQVGGNPWAVTRGTLSGFDGPILKFSGAVEEGNSGGPLLYQGKVIGVIVEINWPFGVAKPSQIAQFTVENWPGFSRQVRIGPKNISPRREPDAGDSAGQRLAALVVTAVPKDADVFVDDELVGNTTQGSVVVSQLSPDTYEVAVTKKGYRPWVNSVELLPGERRELNATLQEGAVVDVTGIWKNLNDPTLSYVLQQIGDRVVMREVTTSVLGTMVTAEGEGQLQGNQLKISYKTALGTTGQTNVTLSEDEKLLKGFFKDTSARVVSPISLVRSDGVPMVLVLAGKFRMGAREDDKDAQSDERPAHPVYLDAFYIDQYEVTTTRYAKFFQEKKRKPPQYWSETVLKQHGKKPVVGVTWDDAKAYCEWAGKRLPTEAEWEKAARGTDERLYPWGNDPPNEKLANFNKCCEFKDYGALTDVGSFERGKSPYGAYDMAGNVWEWVADWYDENLYKNRANPKAESPSNPHGPEKGEFRGLRGGSWDSDARDLRTTNRSWLNQTDWGSDNGFRCAQSVSTMVSPEIDRNPPVPPKLRLKK